jgi:hypothetical protein
MNTESVVNDTPKAAKSDTSKAPKEQKTSTITLTAHGSTLQIIAERWKDSARSYVIVTDPEKKSTRGLTKIHATFEEAQAAIASSAKHAVKIGWTRKVAGRVFQAKPDAFSSIPAAPGKGKK